MALADALPSGPSLVSRDIPRPQDHCLSAFMAASGDPTAPSAAPADCERSKICPNDGSQHPGGIRSSTPTATANPERTFAISAVGREGEILRCRGRMLPENAAKAGAPERSIHGDL